MEQKYTTGNRHQLEKQEAYVYKKGIQQNRKRNKNQILSKKTATKWKRRTKSK